MSPLLRGNVNFTSFCNLLYFSYLFLMRPHQDETGEEGVVIFPEGGRKKVRMGNKVSADKIRQAEHESGGQMRDQHETNMAKVKIETNDEAGNFWQL